MLMNNIETKLYDFEYATHNFRTIDLAQYINECSIDFETPSEHGFLINFDNFLNFDEEHGPIDKIINSYLINYCRLNNI